ncbi:MAG: helix-hairpin-helix domain-containing protein [Dehalococcoidia bacterium]|nr:helix-hairpin-helix domain-containing protein [Dehalococcoidia bacterium]
MKWLERYKAIIVFSLIMLIIVGGIFLYQKQPWVEGGLEVVTSSPSCLITFYVIGEVESPGIYTIDGCSLSIRDAIDAAGGFADGADRDALNLAAPLSNGDVIHVPCLGDVPQRVNINTAEVWLLKALPGIGPTLAQRIVNYRHQNGLFNRIEDLMKVEGIGEATYNKLKDLITVE